MPRNIKRFTFNVGPTRRGSAMSPAKGGYVDSIRAQMRGIETRFAAFTKHLDEATPDVLFNALEPTFEKSQEIVPVRTGDLKASGYLETGRRGSQVFAEMGYGKGGVPPYTVFVHEMVDIHHEPPTQAKFLQQPLEEDTFEIPLRIRDQLEEAAGF